MFLNQLLLIKLGKRTIDLKYPYIYINIYLRVINFG